ncbi:MAG: glycosyl transferase family 2, partial [Chloroflexi bacterium]|nr:glycosyl transferase family 2 [Chloroflexota bacterium]
LRAQGYRFIFVPHAIAYFRPRSNLRAFFKQYYRYARGDGKADLWRKRHAVRYGTYLIALPLLAWLCIRRSLLWGIPLALGAAIMFWTPYKRLWPMVKPLPATEKLKAIGLVPIIRVTGDIAKMLGYPVGVYWRLRHRRDIPRWHDGKNNPSEPG